MRNGQTRRTDRYAHEPKWRSGQWQLMLPFMLVLALCSCGGTRMLKEPVPLQLNQPLVSTSDENMRADLDWVIVRDGPGSWAKKADWDEYLITVKNTGGRPIEITGASVYDAWGYRFQPGDNRKKLVKSSKETVRRNRNLGISVEAGWGSAGTTILVGSAVTVGGIVTMAESMFVGSSAAVGAGAVAGLLVGPAIVTLGVVKVVRNRKVAREIRHRHTRLPLLLAPQNALTMDLFFPLAASPRLLVVDYRIGGDDYRLDVDTESALAGLHILREPPDEK